MVVDTILNIDKWDLDLGFEIRCFSAFSFTNHTIFKSYRAEIDGRGRIFASSSPQFGNDIITNIYSKIYLIFVHIYLNYCDWYKILVKRIQWAFLTQQQKVNFTGKVFGLIDWFLEPILCSGPKCRCWMNQKLVNWKNLSSHSQSIGYLLNKKS